jgi:hypothetical protein
MTNTNSTTVQIDKLFENFAAFLKEKNHRYGDSALQPAMIFSDAPADTQILTRLDDKLNRIKVSKELRKNDVADLCGYLVLLMIQRDWTTFDDLLD